MREAIDLPLHTGKAPRWLFSRMVKLARAVLEVMFVEFSSVDILKKLSDPFWFQSLGCVLGFDWHSSGLTTTTCGAIKQALREIKDSPVIACGGKAKASLKTPLEIEEVGQKLSIDVDELKNTSRLVAKIDNACLQDGFTLYHHMFFFDRRGRWAVIQQGMQAGSGIWARRYHWYGPATKNPLISPHTAIISDKYNLTLNLVDEGQQDTQNLITYLAGEKPNKVLNQLVKLKNISRLPRRHKVLLSDINPKDIYKVLLSSYEQKRGTFSELLLNTRIGPKTLRALALISELIYGETLSFRDPAKFSYAHGGKDGYPYKITKLHYDTTIESLNNILEKAKIERSQRIYALRRLFSWLQSL